MFDSGEGNSYVTPAVKELRMSKSESPRSILGLASEDGVFSREEKASVDEVSMEWEKVYEATPSNPREKRRWNLSCIAW